MTKPSILWAVLMVITSSACLGSEVEGLSSEINDDGAGAFEGALEPEHETALDLDDREPRDWLYVLDSEQDSPGLFYLDLGDGSDDWVDEHHRELLPTLGSFIASSHLPTRANNRRRAAEQLEYARSLLIAARDSTSAGEGRLRTALDGLAVEANDLRARLMFNQRVGVAELRDLLARMGALGMHGGVDRAIVHVRMALDFITNALDIHGDSRTALVELALLVDVLYAAAARGVLDYQALERVELTIHRIVVRIRDELPVRERLVRLRATLVALDLRGGYQDVALAHLDVALGAIDMLLQGPELDLPRPPWAFAP